MSDHATVADAIVTADLPHGYVLGADATELDRLLAQGELFAPEAGQLLDRLGVQPGWRALDVGCGPLGILDLLAERVAPGGEVVGLDREERMLTMARAVIAARGLTGIHLVSGDADATGLPRGAFDLAHARLLLVNVPRPADVLAEMMAVVRPGGLVAVQDVDRLSWTCEPPHPAWGPVVEANRAIWSARGMDVEIGRRLPGLLRAAGFVDVEFIIHTRVFRPGDLYQTLLLTFTRMNRTEIVARGLLTERDVDRAMSDLATHLADPGTLVIFALFCQAWGRRPPIS